MKVFAWPHQRIPCTNVVAVFPWIFSSRPARSHRRLVLLAPQRRLCGAVARIALPAATTSRMPCSVYRWDVLHGELEGFDTARILCRPVRGILS